MDANERVESQLRRSSVKRPWEGDPASLQEVNAWHSSSLPPIDAVPHRRGSIQIRSHGGPIWDLDPDSVLKKAKLERHEYNTFPRQNLAPNGSNALPQNQYPLRNQNGDTLESPAFSPRPRISDGTPNAWSNGGGPADSHDRSNLCRRCRSLIIQCQEPDTVGMPDNQEEWHGFTQEAATLLTHLADTLTSGISSEGRGISRSQGFDERGPGSTDWPPIQSFGRKQTMNWLLGRIYYVNELAEKFVKQAPAASLQTRSKIKYGNGPKADDGPDDIMKRCLDVDSDGTFTPRDKADSSLDSEPHIRRRSVTTTLANDELPPLRSQADLHPSLPYIDGSVQRVAGMNPPPAPNRQLPSPPGRSFPSPTSLSFPSPSTPSYGVNTQGVNLPPPSSLQQQSKTSFLLPINAARSPDSALRDHSAALQHEVSVQKIALSSLQGEHDKLLAAFSRSQTRASALEKKHAVSDNEIISLMEEKLRLQAQVNELERNVEELGRSRDEFRQAAVQEGAQYVEIVQRASRLEEMGKEERKEWRELKEGMERTIAALKARGSSEKDGIGPIEGVPIVSRHENMDAHIFAAASLDAFEPALKMELTNDPRLIEPTSGPSTSGSFEQKESVEDRQAEIQRLRERCAEVENALRSIRDDSRSMEDFVRTIFDRADSTLQG